MEMETIRQILGSKPEATEELPFGPDALVFKVCGKLFAILGWDASPLRVTLKCSPDQAEALRAEFASIQPGYHMNKTHWNTVNLDDTLSDELISEMVNASYTLVVKSLPKADRERLQ